MDFASIWPWIAFNVFVISLLALDLGVFHKEQRAIPVREALWMSAGYVSLALLFCVGLYFFYDRPEVVRDGVVTVAGGSEAAALEFLTGYFIEYTLSMDNIMVFVLILAHFRVPPEYQFRVLVWGILGALVLRALFIFLGAALINAFHGILIVFGLFLIFTGLKTLFVGEGSHDLENDRIVKFSRRLIPMTSRYDGEKFFTVENGKRVATPLFLVLIVLNLTDILFAVDSIPAIFAITQDTFIVYTSNVFAILGLRALYFALAGALDKFHYLRHGISLVLVTIGVKMVVNYFYPKFIPTELALGMTATLIGGSIILSLLRPPVDADEVAQPSPADLEAARKAKPGQPV
ncbi:MAG: TerC family protein [Hyphomicrobiales bacterium]|nr:TerC family protein [Hyphomicrobiales bacterium]